MSEGIKPTTTESKAIDPASALFAVLDSEIVQARERQYQLQRDAEICHIKCQVVGEYRVKMEDMRDKLRAQLDSANAKHTRNPQEDKNL